VVARLADSLESGRPFPPPSNPRRREGPGGIVGPTVAVARECNGMSDDQQFHGFRAPESAPHLRSTFRISSAVSSIFGVLSDSPPQSVSEPRGRRRGGALQGPPSRTRFRGEYPW